VTRNRSFLSFLIIFIFTFIYSFQAAQSLSIDSDIARDLSETIDMAHGNFTLVGPKLSTGLYAGPYYYYLLLPGFLMGNASLSVILIWHAFLFALGLSISFFILSNKKNLFQSFLLIILVGLLPLYIKSARHPGNAFSYLPLLLIFLSIYYLKQQRNSFFFGLFAGIIANFHPVNLLILLPLALFKRKLIRLFSFFSGLAISYLPLIIFEFRHNFVIIRHLFISSPIANFSMQSHYLFPLQLFGFFVLAIFLAYYSHKALILFFIFLALLYFPRQLYQRSSQNISKFQKAVDLVIDKKLVSLNQPFNIIGILKKDAKVPYGDEYRFLFKTKHYFPLPKEDYSSAQSLIIFSQDNQFVLGDYNSHELSQFGLSHQLARESQTDSIKIYYLQK